MDDPEALRQQLRDEAAWRAFVEEQLARETEKTRVWRERAEERAARIERLVAARSLRQALALRLGTDRVPAVGLPDAADVADAAVAALRPAARRPRHPEVRAAGLVTSPALQALLDELDHRDLGELGTAALRDADLGLLATDAWPRDGALREDLLAWLADAVRPPVLWVGAPPPDVAATLTSRDALLDAPPDGPAPSLTPAPWAASTPDRQLPRPGFPGRWVEDGQRRLLVTTNSTAVAVVDAAAPHVALGLAAAGIPVVGPDGGAAHGLPAPAGPIDLDALDRGEPVPEALRRLAIRQRRWVEATATAAVRVDEVLAALAVPHATHDLRLAVLLSSNRPAIVPDQLAALGRQRRRPDEVRLALHGGADGEAERAVRRAAEDAGLPLHLTTPDADVPLGTVLNDLAAATTADLLAKIDDDDHYGPAHLLDAEAALVTTGADLVGRKAHYVHLTGPDHTWLLAGDSEDTWTEQGVMGATFVWRRGLHADVRFLPRPRRVDSLYVRAVAGAGGRMWALPANDFAYVRAPGGRTNIAGEDYVRARGDDVGPGLPLDRVDV